MSRTKSHEINIVVVDFNAKDGNEKVKDSAGDDGLGMRNERGYKLSEWEKNA